MLLSSGSMESRPVIGIGLGLVCGRFEGDDLRL